MSDVKRIRMILMVAVFMVAMLLTFVVPAFAHPTHLVFIPEAGITLSCGDNTDPVEISTCDFEQVGQPAGLVCDIPVSFTAGGEPIPVTGLVCRTPTTASAGTAEEPLPPAPVTQEGEQGSDSGEIDQSFEVS
jgi:hypothetical protein